MSHNNVQLKGIISIALLMIAAAVFFPRHSSVCDQAEGALDAEPNSESANQLNSTIEFRYEPSATRNNGNGSPMPERLKAGNLAGIAEMAVHRKFAEWAKNYSAASLQAKTELPFLAQGEALARDRRAALKTLIETDPKQALALAIPSDVRELLPASISRYLEERISGQGALDVMISENFDEGTCKVQRTARVGDKTYQAFVYGQRLFQTCQSNIPLEGIAIDGSLAVQEKSGVDQLAGTVSGQDDTANALWARDTGGGNSTGNGQESGAGSSYTQGTKRLLFMRVAFPDDPTEPITEAAAYDLMSRVSQCYIEQSYNTTAIIADVTPVLMMPQPKTAYSSLGIPTLLNDAHVVARAAGFDPDNYDLEIVRNNKIPGTTFNFNGFAYVGAKGLVLQDSSLYTAVHELGHNYGLWHANYWSATGDSVIGPGSTAEYGNTFDTMGSQNSNPSAYHFNAQFKDKLNWLPMPFVQVVTNSGLYRIYAYDVPNLVTSQKYALCVQKDYARAYWAEYRQKFTSNPWTQNGVILNWSPWNNYVGNSLGGTALLDTTPGTPSGNNSKDDAPVVIGRTFSDPAAGVHITPIANGTSGSDRWIDVQVNLGSFPSNSPPSLQIAADS
ncbi:MAG: hypothetical protein ACP5MD_10170, partial [Verrucomicrobiia bacterium]